MLKGLFFVCYFPLNRHLDITFNNLIDNHYYLLYRYDRSASVAGVNNMCEQNFLDLL